LRSDRQQKINLLTYRREETEQKRLFQRKIIIITMVTILLVAAGAASWWSQNQRIEALEQQNQQLQEQVEDLSKIAALAGGVSDQEVKELGSRQALLSKLEEERTLDPGQLEEIYALSVPQITIGKMDVKDNGEITINAYTSRQSSLIDFVEKLQKEDFVKEIQRISFKRNDKTGEITFTLVLAGEVTSK